MGAVYIETIEEFEAARSQMAPTYITSTKHGKLLVPCANTFLVRSTLVRANTYNPNSVAGDRMQLLVESILQNGFCFPIVVIFDADLAAFVVIDGFHRKLVGSEEYLDFDYLPVVVLDHDITQRMTATMQFNRARGIHQVDLDAEVVRALSEQGMPDEEIATKLGMDVDAVYRYKQLTGYAELFKNIEHSGAWEMVDDEE